MTLHSFIEYLKYQWGAKGRHGTHSPFVYNFVEQVLLDKNFLQKEYLIEFPELELKYENLICRIAAYYNCKHVVYLSLANTDSAAADMLLINDAPAKWVNLLNEHLSLLKNESIVIATDIHKTLAYSNAWDKLSNHPKVLMSIDLYGIGLLFFKEEFKEKQHFILKY